MIYTERPVPAAQDVLDALARLSKTGQTEIEAARAYYNAAQRPKKAYPFSRYKEYEVCYALDQMFSRKCAYCESKYEAVAARDVEHYRPKGKVDKAPAHPGYWWLAAEWTNLLPSCPACNQRRRHVEYRKGMTLEEIERAEQTQPRRTSGKGNAFPVRDDKWVTIEGGALAGEDPFLINPCVRDPLAHLEWVFDYDRQFPLWDAAPVLPLLRPRRTAQAEDDPYAAASIAIYGLNRAGVFRARMEHVALMQNSCKTYADTFLALAKLADLSTPAAQALQQTSDNAYLAMSRFMKPNMLYAGMARAFIAAIRAELAGLGNPGN